MKTTIILALLGLALTSCSSPKSEQPTGSSTGQPQAYEVSKKEMTKTATVTKVDYKTRKITLDVNGKPTIVTAGKEIENLDQIKKGDTVMATYEEAIVYDINKGGAPSERKAEQESWTSQPGQQPGAGTKTVSRATLLVKDIDRSTPSITLQNAKGERQTFKVMYPERLEELNVGDAIDVTYTQATALKFEKQDGADRAPASK